MVGGAVDPGCFEDHRVRMCVTFYHFSYCMFLLSRLVANAKKVIEMDAEHRDGLAQYPSGGDFGGLLGK